MEIERLHKMLTYAGIKHEWLDRHEVFKVDNAGWQVLIRDDKGDKLLSAIEGFGTYGFGGPDHGILGTDEKDGDLIEIMVAGEVEGYLTATEVYGRIIKLKERKK